MPKKKREPNWLSHVIWSSQGFHPQFWICLTCGSYSSLNQRKSCQDKIVANLVNWWYPISLSTTHFPSTTITLKLRMKQGLQGQTRPQRQYDCTDNFSTVLSYKEGNWGARALGFPLYNLMKLWYAKLST